MTLVVPWMGVRRSCLWRIIIVDDSTSWENCVSAHRERLWIIGWSIRRFMVCSSSANDKLFRNSSSCSGRSQLQHMFLSVLSSITDEEQEMMFEPWLMCFLWFVHHHHVHLEYGAHYSTRLATRLHLLIIDLDREEWLEQPIADVRPWMVALTRQNGRYSLCRRQRSSQSFFHRLSYSLERMSNDWRWFVRSFVLSDETIDVNRYE